jgi:hypothetical protein
MAAASTGSSHLQQPPTVEPENSKSPWGLQYSTKWKLLYERCAQPGRWYGAVSSSEPQMQVWSLDNASNLHGMLALGGKCCGIHGQGCGLVKYALCQKQVNSGNCASMMPVDTGMCIVVLCILD